MFLFTNSAWRFILVIFVAVLLPVAEVLYSFHHWFDIQA